MIQISILIPTYNFKTGLIRILDGFTKCASSDLNKLEIIIGDDSEKRIISQLEILQYKKYIKNLKYIYNKGKKGGVNNWNNLINLASGKYYWLLHHDEFLYNPSFALKNIINNLQMRKSIYILPIIKRKTFLLLNILKIEFEMHQLPYKKLLNYFLNNSNYFLYLNVLGSPSSLLVKREIKLRYNRKLKWLVDVEFYSRLFKDINPKNVKVFNYKSIYLISDQNYPNSISRILKKRNKLLNKLRKNELYLVENIENSLIKNISILFAWYKYKFFGLKKIKYKISRINILNKKK